MATVLDNDIRLDDRQIAMMEYMVEQGIDEREAKIRVMCIAVPPDHHKSMPAKAMFARAVYHPDGRVKTAKSAEDFAAALEAGWLDKPQRIHVDLAQEPNRKQLEQLEKELERELRSVRSRLDRGTGFDVPPAVVNAAAKRKAGAKP